MAGNYVGTDWTGTVAVPNYAGIYIQNQAPGNLIGANGDGGSDALERNIISGNEFAGVWLSNSGTNDVVAGNYIGADVTGESGLGNAVGVWLNVASDDWVGVNSVDGPENSDEGNLISANYYFGVELDAPASNDVVAGNDVGSNADGTTALSNGGFAIVFTGGTDNVIGLPGAGNLISAANDSPPIALSFAVGTVIQSNRIGTTADGMAVLPGQFSGEGILVENSPGTLIGGTTPGTGNLISIGPWTSAYAPISTTVGGFIWNADGIDITSGFDSTTNSAGTVIEGNLIGTDASGEGVLGNPNFGIALVNASDITIGGTAPGAANVIAGNSQGGIAILSGQVPPSVGTFSDLTSSDNLIEGNLIGVNFDSNGDPIEGLGNGSAIATFSGEEAGVYLNAPASDDQPAAGNTIGGTTAGAANIIANNVGPGVAIVGASAFDEPVLGNTIYGNAGLAIDLGDDGVTPDHSIPTTGIVADAPNGLQNFPILSSAVFAPDTSDPDGTLTVGGTLEADPDSTYLIQLFANSMADPSGYGQGQTLIGSFAVTTDDSAEAEFSNTFATPNLAGEVISATATDANGNTSELSQDLSVIGESASSVVVPIIADPATEQSLLQSVVSEVEDLPAGTTPPNVELQPADAGQLDLVVAAINGLSSESTPVTVAVDLGGQTYQTDTTLNPPSGVQLVIQNGTLIGGSPALTVDGGSVTLIGVTAINNTTAPTILVAGGSLIVRNSTIDGSTVPGEAAVSITGGTVDLGTSASPGGNLIDISAGDEFAHNMTAASVPSVGDTFNVNGTTQSATELSFTSLSSSVLPSVFGQSVTLTATIRPDNTGDPTPAGSVTFIDETTGLTLATVNLNRGTARFATSSLGTGTQDIIASYSGDTRYLLSLDQLPQSVDQAATTTKLSSSANPSVYGQSVNFTATIKAVAPASGVPTGTVTFYDGGAPIGTGTLGGGVATFSTAFLAVGSHPITVSYGGDANFTGSSSGALSQTVKLAGTTTMLTSAENPSVFGESLTLTATVTANSPGSGTPTGIVTFTQGSTVLGSGTLSNGSVSVTTTVPIPVGMDTIKASYGGGGNFKTSAGTASERVDQDATTTAVVTSANPSAFGQSVTFTATVSANVPGNGTPTGTVTFMDGSTKLGTVALSSGTASYSTTKLSTALHTIAANYNGSSSFTTSTGSLSQVVNQDVTTAAVTSSLNPSIAGQAVTFTATVSANAPGSGTPTGTIAIFVGSTQIGTGTLSGGKATFKTKALVVGTHTITAEYGGDTNFTGSTSAALIQTVSGMSAIAVAATQVAVDAAIGALGDASAPASVIDAVAFDQISTGGSSRRSLLRQRAI